MAIKAACGKLTTGKVAVFVTLTLITAVVIVYFAFVWPQVLARLGGEGLALHFALGLMLLAAILYTYACATLTPPGYLQASEMEAQHSKESKGNSDFCYKCNVWRPLGTHHCSTCRRCVLKLDHHCLIMDTCIGQQNYRLYFLFLIYLLAGSTFNALSVLVLLRDTRSEDQPVLMIASFVLTAAVAVCLLPLITFHFVLILLGMSTIDALRLLEIDGWRQFGRQLRGTTWSIAQQNIKAAFDVNGQWWWLLWILPG